MSTGLVRLHRCCLLAVLFSVACAKAPPAPQSPLAGNVKLHLLSKAHSATAGAAPEICATFTLTPFALGAAGEQTLAGAPVVVSGTGPSASPILGCVSTPGVSPDWRYLVTASNFAGCSAPVSGTSPSIETFIVDLTCAPG